MNTVSVTMMTHIMKVQLTMWHSTWWPCGGDDTREQLELAGFLVGQGEAPEMIGDVHIKGAVWVDCCDPARPAIPFPRDFARHAGSDWKSDVRESRRRL